MRRVSEGYSINDLHKSIHVFEGEHSPWGPSSAKRWINCPGSVNATKDIPDPGSQWAAEGTAAHTVSELCRVRGCHAAAFIGYRLKVGAFTFDFDKEFAASVQEFIDWCNEAPGRVLIEQKVHYFLHQDEKQKAFGTLDDGRLSEPLCVITDFKHGKGVQEFAKENPQLMLQAIGVLEDFGWLYDIDEFELRICQPRLDHKDKWRVSKTDLWKWWRDTIPAAYLRTVRGTDFKAGEWCRFCRIKQTCAVRANMALQAVTGTTFDALPEDPPLRVLATLKPNDLAQLGPLLKSIKQWCVDVEHAIVIALQQGKVVGDAKMVEGRSNRRWTKADNMPALLRAEGVEPYEKSLRSVADVEGEMGKKIFAEKYGEHVTKPPGKPKLAFGDDPRPPVKREVLTTFTNLTEDDD